MDEKLKAARAEIEAILKAHDLAGFVVMHCEVGKTSAFHCVSPSYSKITTKETDGAVLFEVRISSDDYGGDTQAARQAAEVTKEMLKALSMRIMMASTPIIDLANRMMQGAEDDAEKADAPTHPTH